MASGGPLRTLPVNTLIWSSGNCRCNPKNGALFPRAVLTTFPNRPCLIARRQNATERGQSLAGSFSWRACWIVGGGWHGSGEHTKVGAYLARMTEELPGSVYAQRAQLWCRQHPRSRAHWEQLAWAVTSSTEATLVSSDVQGRTRFRPSKALKARTMARPLAVIDDFIVRSWKTLPVGGKSNPRPRQPILPSPAAAQSRASPHHLSPQEVHESRTANSSAQTPRPRARAPGK